MVPPAWSWEPRGRGSTGGDGSVTTHPGWPGLRCSQDAGLRTLNQMVWFPRVWGSHGPAKVRYVSRQLGAKVRGLWRRNTAPTGQCSHRAGHLAPASSVPTPFPAKELAFWPTLLGSVAADFQNKTQKPHDVFLRSIYYLSICRESVSQSW